MFRNDSLAGNSSALIDRLNREGVLRRWAMDEPALRGVDRIEDLARLTAVGADPARADQLIGALVRIACAAGGHDDDALLLLLHLLSDLAVAMAGQLSDLCADTLTVIVGELACQIRSVDPRRPVRCWATALKWLTRHAVLAELRPTARRFPEVREAPVALEPDNPVWSRTWVPLGSTPPQPGCDTGDVELVDVLLCAVRSGVAREDIALLAATETARAGKQHRVDQAVADAFGVNVRTLYRRNNRTLAALRAVGADYLASVA